MNSAGAAAGRAAIRQNRKMVGFRTGTRAEGYDLAARQSPSAASETTGKEGSQHKTIIKRRAWRHKIDVVAEAPNGFRTSGRPTPNSGSLRHAAVSR